MIGGLILAAGSGSRFGGPKQLAELDGKPLVSHAVDAMLAVPAIEHVVVVVGARGEEVARALDPEAVQVHFAEGWEEGMAASLRAGTEVLEGCEAVIITLADQPFITSQVIAAIVDHADGRAPAARATYRGAPGHPVMIKRSLYEDVARLRGDQGARNLLDDVGARTLECGHLANPLDVDTQTDLELARRERVARMEA